MQKSYAMMLAVVALVFLSVLAHMATAQDVPFNDNVTSNPGSGSCPGARELLRRSGGGPGTTRNTFPEFTANSASFLVSISTTATSATPNPHLGEGVSVGVYEGGEATLEANVASLFVNAGDSQSSLIREGTGTYSIAAASTNAEYTIIVKECTGAGTEGAGTGEASSQPASQPGPSPTPNPIPRQGSRDLLDAGGPTAPPFPTMSNGKCPSEWPVKRIDGCYPMGPTSNER